MEIDQPTASGSSSPKRSNIVYIPDGNSFSAVAQAPQVPLTTRPSAGGEAVVCIDNGSHSWRAGFAGSADPYIDKANMVARYKERKVGKNIMLFGRDVEADSNSRSSIRSMFDGDMLIHGEILECALDYTFLLLGFNGDRIDAPIVMTERLANPLFTRAMTSEMLFELYGAPSVTYGVDSLFAYSRQKHADGLAINMGHNSTTIIPVADGKGILSRAKRIPWGGSQADELMLKLAQLKYPAFPLKVTGSQATFMTRETCYFATDYEAELRDMATPAGLAAATTVVQFPYTAQEVIEKTEAELAAQAEKRKEQGKRLQEMQIKMRADKLAEQVAQVEQYKALLAERAAMDPDDWLQELYSTTDFDTPQELESWVKKTEGNIKRKQKKDAGEEEVEEDPVFPLVDRPDEELTEDEIKEKRRQRLMKAGWEARVKIREEKQREKDRVEEERRQEEEERATDPEGWARKMRLQHEAVILRLEERKKQKTQRKDRKSVASQNRMKTIANLAAEEKVSTSKKRKKGDDDDGFGKDDADWAVYREVGGDDESDAEEEDENALNNIETQLLQYDPSFTEDDTLSGRAHAKNALINAFVRGGNKERFNPDDLRQTYQLHLNVERIRVPETWFQPSMFGHDSAGLGEIAGWVMGGFEEEQRKRMMQCIFVTGGSSLIPNLIPRLRSTLTPVLPFRAPLKIVTSLDGGDPRLEAWRGMAQWAATDEAKQARVTRQEYEEHGGEWLEEHAWGNLAA